LCKGAPAAFASVLGQDVPGLGVSIGVATRRIGSIESIGDLSRRADAAMYEVKRNGRGHWRVSLLEGDS
jgi:GGDEF domain-containing protein